MRSSLRIPHADTSLYPAMPMLLKTVQSKRIDAKQLMTQRFELYDILQAYDTFSRAADTKALKVIIEAWRPET